MISNFRESDTKWIPEFPVCGCSCSPSLKKLSNWLPPACVGRAQRGLRTFLWTNVAANVGACAGSSGSGMWWVLRYCGHWVGDMSNGDLWSLGTRKWAPMWGQATMLWSECWEPGERGISDQMWAGALFSWELEPDVLCAPGHFLEIRSMVEEGWDWTQWTNSIRMYQWQLSQTSPNSSNASDVTITQNVTTPIIPKKNVCC